MFLEVCVWVLEALMYTPLPMLPESKMIPRRGFQQMSWDVTEGSVSVPLEGHRQMLGQEPGAGAAVCTVVFRLRKLCVYLYA